MTVKELKQLSSLLGQYMNEMTKEDSITETACVFFGVKAQYDHARMIRRRIDTIISRRLRTNWCSTKNNDETEVKFL